MADTGNQATIVFATSGFTANYHMIGSTEQERGKIKDSHLGTVDYHTYIPGDLIEPGEMECELEFNPDDEAPIDAPAETITITYPVPAGMVNGATLAGSGFLTKRSTPDLKNGELMLGKFTVAWDGKTGPTFTPASAV